MQGWRDSQQRVVLLTGVTGFLGRRLLDELLEQTDCTVVCLVRAKSDIEAQRRGRSLSSDLRVVYVRADLESPRLGLTEDAWERLAGKINEIYHCAASVSFDQPLKDARRINVAGTRRLLELAQAASSTGSFRRMHHVSTAYVAGKRSGEVSADYLPADSGSAFRNSYERSKAEAERLLRDQRDVPVSIYRPSIVCGDTQTGKTDNFNVLYVPMRLIHKGVLRQMPRAGAARLDAVGVDYVVRGILEFSRVNDAPLQSFHLTAGDTFSISDFVKVSVEETQVRVPESGASCSITALAFWDIRGLAAQLLTKLPRRSPVQWVQNVRRKAKLADRGVKNFAPYAPYCGVNTRFSCATEAEFLARRGVTHPPALDYLKTVAAYAIESQFGSRVPEVIRSFPQNLARQRAV